MLAHARIYVYVSMKIQVAQRPAFRSLSREAPPPRRYSGLRYCRRRLKVTRTQLPDKDIRSGVCAAIPPSAQGYTLKHFSLRCNVSTFLSQYSRFVLHTQRRLCTKPRKRLWLATATYHV
ncbi:hypothetical protein ABW21_db0209526 [Orbilia brochopaga]|nr:hypothetical protein ABW21_db0209526 [Drechslerella brochopaga]